MYEMLKPLLFTLPPECAHHLAGLGLKLGIKTPLIKNLIKKDFKDEILSQNLLGLNFANPIGIGGGFDKNADLAYGLSYLGFGFLEYGTFTPRPQSGNPRPRLWRIKEHNSLQNAMGFNNEGSAAVEQNIAKYFPLSLPVFANIGKNKTTPNESAINDYIYLAKRFEKLCDGFVINISSPNTPNLRELQNDEFLSTLGKELRKITNNPLVLKIAPDMQPNAAVALCQCAIESGFNAIIINNTSIDYSLCVAAKSIGGLSGELICAKSRELFSAVASEIFGKAVLISCGGISDAREALWRIKHGASLIEIFTALIYKGPAMIENLNKELANLLKIEGFENISQAVGSALKK